MEPCFAVRRGKLVSLLALRICAQAYIRDMVSAHGPGRIWIFKIARDTLDRTVDCMAA